MQGAAFWAAAGFVGGWAEDQEDEDDNEDDDEQAGMGGDGRAPAGSSEWDDSEPVFEIRETEEGVEGELVKYESQTAFEKGSSYPF